MEEDGLVTRTEYLEVPIRVEYNVTDKATELGAILAQLAQWALHNEYKLTSGAVCIAN